MEWSRPADARIVSACCRNKGAPGSLQGALAGRFLALIFEKPSLRTRVTFEVGMASLGGSAIFLDHTLRISASGKRARRGKNLERWVNGIVARVFTQESLEELAKNANVPVINALSDMYHPCQAFADFFTLEERFGSLRGLKFAYIGDGNNMCHSLLPSARAWERMSGSRLRRVRARRRYCRRGQSDAARETRGKIEILRSPEEAVAGTQAVYTDVWASMGQEEESAARAADFADYQVNDSLFCASRAGCCLYALPAGAPRTRSDRRGDRLAAVDHFRSSRKSPACAESDSATLLTKFERRTNCRRKSCSPIPEGWTPRSLFRG